jgi:hypothetical protein
MSLVVISYFHESLYVICSSTHEYQ